MAHQKHPKSQNKGSKKQSAAKQAAQKKLKDRRATKFRNEELRMMLDSETSAVYSVCFRYFCVVLSLMLCTFPADQ
jgi:hypothetical protein